MLRNEHVNWLMKRFYFFTLPVGGGGGGPAGRGMNIDNPGSAAAGGGVGVGRPDEKKVYFKCRETKLGNEKLFRFYPAGLGAGRKVGEAWEGL